MADSDVSIYRTPTGWCVQRRQRANEKKTLFFVSRRRYVKTQEHASRIADEWRSTVRLLHATHLVDGAPLRLPVGRVERSEQAGPSLLAGQGDPAPTGVNGRHDRPKVPRSTAPTATR